MTLVRALRAHTNNFGAGFEKSEGDEYEHPAPAQLVKHGFVALVDPEADDLAAAAEAFIARRLDDITKAELAALSPAMRAAVIAAERDREQPRTGLLGRLGVQA